MRSVEESRSRVPTRNGLAPESVIELTVRNGTKSPISRAYFNGTLATPGRSVPWHQDSFYYAIPGEIEPGEEATWSLTASRRSDWDKMDYPDDAVFTVTVERLDEPEGKTLYSVHGFGDWERSRLEELKSRFGVE